MLILASNSPRRRQLLSLGGWDYSVLAVNVDEASHHQESPGDYVLRLAEQKALAIFDLIHDQYKRNEIDGQTLILAADTAVVDQGENSQWTEILGKPSDESSAESMLLRLRGRVHRVATGLVVLRLSDQMIARDVVISNVTMRSYSLGEIKGYIASGDPFDKAGAYAIQHPTFNPVQYLQGCYANVMGLPLCRAAQMLTEIGYPATRDVPHECRQALNISCEIYAQFLQNFQRQLSNE